MWYLRDYMDACIRQIVFRAIVIFLIGLFIGFFMSCQTPYSGHLGPEDFNGWIESEENGFVCLWNGFDRICVRTLTGAPGKDGTDGRDGVDGTDGKDGKDGTDGQTLIAIREVPLEIIVEKIIETVVVEEVIKEVPVGVVVERVVTEYVDREVPIEVFVGETVEVITEVVVERIVEVPEKIIEIEVIREVPVEKIVEVIKTVYVEVPAAPETISVTEGKIYTEPGYNNPPSGFHSHTFTHTHDGATHTHQIIHPNGEQDDWAREHNGFSGLMHD